MNSSIVPVHIRMQKYIVPVTESGCYLWIGSENAGGYGQIYDHEYRRARVAHKIAYEIINGPVTPGMHLDHVCRVRCCVNPSHLRVVTSAENSFAPGSIARNNLRRLATHCIHGHEFNEKNTYFRKDGHGRRECRACHNQRRRK